MLDEAPLIVAGGADVQRRSTIELHDGAVAALRDTVTLGRHGEQPGALESTLRATLAGTPLLHDGLRIARPDPHVALAPGHRIITTLCLLGTRPAADLRPASDATPGVDEPSASADSARHEPAVLTLAGPGALARATAIAHASPRALTSLWRAWVTIASTHDQPSP